MTVWAVVARTVFPVVGLRSAIDAAHEEARRDARELLRGAGEKGFEPVPIKFGNLHELFQNSLDVLFAEPIERDQISPRKDAEQFVCAPIGSP